MDWKRTSIHLRLGGKLALALLGLVLLGCSGDKGPKRYRISGEVTCEGRPVPIGAIQFTPDASQGNSGPPAFAEIKEGRYDTTVSGKGFIGGPHIVAIDAFSGKNIDPDLLPNGEPIQQGFQKTFDLPVDQDVTLDIELTKT